MPTRDQLTHERLTALLEMLAADGATPAGEPPGPEHVDALRATAELGEAGAVAAAFEQGDPPPAPTGGEPP